MVDCVRRAKRSSPNQGINRAIAAPRHSRIHYYYGMVCPTPTRRPETPAATRVYSQFNHGRGRLPWAAELLQSAR